MEDNCLQHYFVVAQYVYSKPGSSVEHTGLVNGCMCYDTTKVTKQVLEDMNLILVNKIKEFHSNRKILDFSIMNINYLGYQDPATWA